MQLEVALINHCILVTIMLLPEIPFILWVKHAASQIFQPLKNKGL
jgi:hypothetical protein